MAERRAIALVSGGLDSAVSLALALNNLDIRLALFCDYGQRALASEKASVIAIVSYYEIPLQEVGLTWLRDLSPRGMRNQAANTISGVKPLPPSLKPPGGNL